MLGLAADGGLRCRWLVSHIQLLSWSSSIENCVVEVIEVNRRINYGWWLIRVKWLIFCPCRLSAIRPVEAGQSLRIEPVMVSYFHILTLKELAQRVIGHGQRWLLRCLLFLSSRRRLERCPRIGRKWSRVNLHVVLEAIVLDGERGFVGFRHVCFLGISGQLRQHSR